MNIPVWVSGAMGVFLAALIAYCVRLNSIVRDQGNEIVKLQTQMAPLWARVQAKISADLHHDDPRLHETDTLIDRLQALTITEHERSRLKVLLKERSVDMHTDISPAERQKARVLIEVMDFVVTESLESNAT